MWETMWDDSIPLEGTTYKIYNYILSIMMVVFFLLFQNTDKRLGTTPKKQIEDVCQNFCQIFKSSVTGGRTIN